MRNLQLPDCTLKDGVQVNEARFGNEPFVKIIENRDDGLGEWI